MEEKSERNNLQGAGEGGGIWRREANVTVRLGNPG